VRIRRSASNQHLRYASSESNTNQSEWHSDPQNTVSERRKTSRRIGSMCGASTRKTVVTKNAYPNRMRMVVKCRIFLKWQAVQIGVSPKSNGCQKV
jgi:hypothetical protein